MPFRNKYQQLVTRLAARHLVIPYDALSRVNEVEFHREVVGFAPGSVKIMLTIMEPVAEASVSG